MEINNRIFKDKESPHAFRNSKTLLPDVDREQKKVCKLDISQVALYNFTISPVSFKIFERSANSLPAHFLTINFFVAYPKIMIASKRKYYHGNYVDSIMRDLHCLAISGCRSP